MLIALEWIGSICGVLGAFIIASNTRVSPSGWWLFLASSIALCGYSVLAQAWGLLLLNACFVVTNLTGLVRWCAGGGQLFGEGAWPMPDRGFPSLGSPVIGLDENQAPMKGIVIADHGSGLYQVSFLNGQVLEKFGEELLPDENFDVAVSWHYVQKRDGH